MNQSMGGLPARSTNPQTQTHELTEFALIPSEEEEETKPAALAKGSK